MAETTLTTAEDLPPMTDELRDVLRWHAAWAVMAVLSLVLLAAAMKGMPWTASLALLAGGAPGAAGLLLRRRDRPGSRAVLLAVWSGCGALAAMLAGGFSGPLAVWCLAPVAAATVFGAPRLLAEAVALSLVAAATMALAGLAHLTPVRPAAPFDFWLGFIGLVSTGLGLGAGLLLARRRAAQREMQRKSAETRLERLLSEQPHLILALERAGTVLSAFGYAPAGIDAGGLPGRRLADLGRLADQPRITAALGAALVSGAGECVFAPAAAPDRSCALDVRRDADGRLLAVVRDATAQADREAALQAARETAEALNAGKSRFLANMSHELRTPLNAIMGFSDVMRTKLFGDLPPRYAEYAELIHDAGRHLLELINDVLDISKIEAERYELSREVFDAREPVSAALRLTRLQADDAGVSLRGLLPPAALEVEADPRAVRQIVLNLISNALKFTPRGGSVTVTVQDYGEDLEIVVSDSGVGIAEADLERLGRPYEQAGDAAQKVRGTGLGLSLVRAFAELHGGGMSIESRLGEGTSVTVRIPVVRRVPAPAPPAGAQIIAFKPSREVGA